MCIILPLTDIRMKGCDFMYTRYVCSYCGKEFVDKATCRRHEMVEHGKYNEIAAAYLVSGKNPCDFCNNAYYVYGCEFDCKHKMDCQYRNGYKHFDGKDVSYGA